MKTVMRSLLGLAVLAMTVSTAFGTGKPTDPGQPATNPNTPTTHPGKSYGTYCKALSKKHVAGQKGTPFSQCVVAMAQLKKGTATSPQKACSKLSKKHVAGQKGTPFSQCVVAGAQLLKDKNAST